EHAAFGADDDPRHLRGRLRSLIDLLAEVLVEDRAVTRPRDGLAERARRHPVLDRLESLGGHAHLRLNERVVRMDAELLAVPRRPVLDALAVAPVPRALRVDRQPLVEIVVEP